MYGSSQPYNSYGHQPPKPGYNSPQQLNTDIYGKTVINPSILNQEKSIILKEVEQNFNVKTLHNQMIGSQKCEILNVNLIINKDLSLPVEMYY